MKGSSGRRQVLDSGSQATRFDVNHGPHSSLTMTTRLAADVSECATPGREGWTSEIFSVFFCVKVLILADLGFLRITFLRGTMER